MKFEFDAKDLDGELVVFERMFDSDGHIVAKHEDINSGSQTVKLIKKVVESENSVKSSEDTNKKTGSSVSKNPKTGDNMLLKVVAALMLISICSIFYIVYRKSGSK